MRTDVRRSISSGLDRDWQEAGHGPRTSLAVACPAETQLAIPAPRSKRLIADGVRVFYRAAGHADAPGILLLHGFPTSSFMFRELIPRRKQ